MWTDVTEPRNIASRVEQPKNGNNENKEDPSGHPSMNDLLAAKQQEQGNSDRTENVHEGGTYGRSCHRTQVGAKQTLCSSFKLREFPCLHAEGLYDAVAGDGFVKNVLDIREFVLTATCCA